MEGEQIQLSAELAMVALLRLLETPQVSIQLLGGVPGGPVDALEHRTRLVAAPVGARRVQQLEGAEVLRGAEVPAAAEILEGPVTVEADGRSLGLVEVVDNLDLEWLAPRLQLGDGIGARQVLRMLEGKVGSLLLLHLRLDLLEVGRRERAGQVEVVVEAVLDGRTDAELRRGEQFQNGRGHHVGGRMPHGGQVVPQARCERRLLADIVRVDRHGSKPNV
jgi:hypothetical protein